MAAEGLGNREIGQRLHLSPRTVGTYLYRIFPSSASAPAGSCRRYWGPSARDSSDRSHLTDAAAGGVLQAGTTAHGAPVRLTAGPPRAGPSAGSGR
ncbi:helix-turn-helix transcriptional regulator [Streptacidiphilus sp. 4-A2]|nr:helix-turn-helix transcriptional regulator [Streptacidiphilus sp. 4-A2]